MPRLKHESGKYYVKAAEKAGLQVSNGRGDHAKVYAPNGQMMVIPQHRQLATGTECAVVKFLLAFGVVLPAIVCAISCWLMGQV